MNMIIQSYSKLMAVGLISQNLVKQVDQHTIIFDQIIYW